MAAACAVQELITDISVTFCGSGLKPPGSVMRCSGDGRLLGWPAKWLFEGRDMVGVFMGAEVGSTAFDEGVGEGEDRISAAS